MPAYVNLAVLLAKEGKGDEALELLQRALELNPAEEQSKAIQEAIDKLQKEQL
jgi:tetratricopeptide (TPR) repeat protein